MRAILEVVMLDLLWVGVGALSRREEQFGRGKRATKKVIGEEGPASSQGPTPVLAADPATRYPVGRG